MGGWPAGDARGRGVQLQQRQGQQCATCKLLSPCHLGEKTGEREVTFKFDEKNNKELPAIVGDFPILPKHWYEGKDA